MQVTLGEVEEKASEILRRESDLLWHGSLESLLDCAIGRAVRELFEEEEKQVGPRS